ncbi:MAG: hypothetical protein J5I93_23640 [Pirellulaceae bacterium]|nr:hypothetical protein [Pirellulaceae bacterium]
MKDWQERIDETIDFIGGATVPAHADKRAAIARLLREANQQALISQGLSTSMSQGTNWSIRHRDRAKLNRSYRRAIILIRVQLLNQVAVAVVAAVDNIPDGGLPTALGNDLGTVFAHEQQPLTNALLALQANPGNWLANNKIQLQGTVHSGAMNYGFFLDTHGNRYTFKPPNAIIDEVYISPVVYHVHVQKYLAVAGNPAAIQGEHLVGSNIMITTQLTGCAVMYETDAAHTNMVATHIQPEGPPNSAGRGYNLVATLRGGGVGFANPPGGVTTRAVFGSGQGGQPHDYDPNANPPRHTFCIGIRTVNGWELHCQRHNIGVPADNIEYWRIL